MNKGFIFFVLLFILTLSVKSQTHDNEVKKISGIVQEGDSESSASQATVRLFQLPDSTLVTGVFSDNKGFFEIKNIKTGNYLIDISYLGYENYKKQIEVTDKNVDLSVIFIQPHSKMLSEAVVIGHVSDVIVKQDTIEYNAGSYGVPPGSMTEDLLKRLPGVEVDAEGKVKSEGKEIKKILVDGKEFFGEDAKMTMKNLPTDIINKIQVVDRKSELSRLTGIDDGDDEKIINITIKQGMKNGWFGNAVVGGGTKIDGENRYEASTMINRFKDENRVSFLANFNNTNNQAFSELGGDLVPQINVRGRGGRSGGSGITKLGSFGMNTNLEFSKKLKMDGSLVYGSSNTDAWSNSQKQNILRDSLFYTNDSAFNYNESKNLAGELSFEYKPDSLTQINFRPRFSYNDSFSEETGTTVTLDGSPDRALVNRSNSSTTTDGSGYNLSGALDISRKSQAKDGRRVSLRLAGGMNNGDADGMNKSTTDYFDPATQSIMRSEIIDQFVKNENQSYNYQLNASYIEPILDKRFLQLSYSIRVNNSDSKKNAYNWDNITNAYTELDSTYTRNFRNEFVNQQINASLQTVREKYDYTVGVELSPSYSKSERYIGDTILLSRERSVLNFAPTARINYRFTKQRSLQFSYRGQTSQPSMTQLDPTPDISNPLNIRVGNPDLKPSFTHRIFLRFNDYDREKQQSLGINGRLNIMQNNVTNVSSYDESGVQTIRYENVNGTWDARLQAFYNTPLRNQRFRINSDFTSSYNHVKGFVTSRGDSQASENISKTWSLGEVAGISYRSPVVEVGTRFSIRYNNTSNSLESRQDQAITDYGVGGNFSVYLPYNFVLASDINYTDRRGYSAGYTQSEVIWNAEISTRFMKDNRATVKFKVYDILQDRKNISRSVTANSITDRQFNTMTSYCMLYFIYNFNAFGGGSSNRGGDRERNREGGGYRRGGGGEGRMPLGMF